MPLRTVVKRLSYSTAAQMSRILQTGGRARAAASCRSAARCIVDARTNTLIIKELPNYIDTVLAVIETLDIPEPQVMIEARIVETTKRFDRTLGIQWGFEAVADAAHGNTTGLMFPNNGEVEGGVNVLTGGSNGFIDLALGNILDTFTLDMRLQAAESEGLINVLSAPKVATLNNETATIQSGLQIPIQTVANNTVTVQFVNATLRLQVTPHVTAEGTVLLDVNVQKREPQLAFAVAGAQNAPIATKDAQTRVIVRDGGTTVIGGIYKVSTDQGQDRVPGLANVPILGELFKNRRRLDENDELLIFITPRVDQAVTVRERSYKMKRMIKTLALTCAALAFAGLRVAHRQGRRRRRAAVASPISTACRSCVSASVRSAATRRGRVRSPLQNVVKNPERARPAT